jgi:hypothetical protein
MDLSVYVDALRRELVVAAEAGGDDARALAERLVAPLDSAARLTLLEALSAAADEITRDLAPGSVEVRLRGRDPDFVVTPPPADPTFADAPASGPADVAPDVQPPVGPPPGDGDEGTSRITLRLPTHLKPRIDDAAGRAGLSVNAWLVRAVSTALEPDDRARNTDRTRGTQFGRRYSGWVR